MPLKNHSQTPLNQIPLLQRLHTILHDDPTLNDKTWFEIQPCKSYTFFSRSVVITQPSSTFWVYFLGLLTSAVGLYFFMTGDDQTSRILWGWSLLLWGIGALIAGTSYQAFGYQLKCAGRDVVVWTSWWEVIYLIFQQVSLNVMLVAVVYSGVDGVVRTIAIWIAVLLSIGYTLMVLLGAIKPKKDWITFERMSLFCMPIVVFFVFFNAWRYATLNQPLDLALLGTWFGLILTMVLYGAYYKSGLTQRLWSKGRWFSENDVLHVALVIWILYIAFVVAPLVKDYT